MKKREDQIVDLSNAGFSERAIGAKLKISQRQVHKVLEAKGAVKPNNTIKAAVMKGVIDDPNRADRLLRRFSWQEATQ